MRAQIRAGAAPADLLLCAPACAPAAITAAAEAAAKGAAKCAAKGAAVAPAGAADHARGVAGQYAVVCDAQQRRQHHPVRVPRCSAACSAAARADAGVAA